MLIWNENWHIDYDYDDDSCLVKPLNLFAKLLAFCIEVYFKPKSPCIFINIPFTKSRTKLVVVKSHSQKSLSKVMVKSHGQNAAKVDPWARLSLKNRVDPILFSFTCLGRRLYVIRDPRYILGSSYIQRHRPTISRLFCPLISVR